MTKFKATVAFALLVVATNGLAAATDESRYRKIWDKSIGSATKPRVGCVCSNGNLGALAYKPAWGGW